MDAIETSAGGAAPFAEVERTALGLRLRGSSLHLDPRGRSQLGFLAHARGARATLPERLIATAATATLLEAAQPRALRRAAPLPAAFGKRFALGGLRLTLHPAGFVRGSAQLRCEPDDGPEVLYSGDLGGAGPTASLTAEPREASECETLVLRACLGHPRYVLPPRAEVLAALVRFVEETRARGLRPVVLAAQLGSSQDVVKHLGDLGFALRLHPAVLRATEAYRSLGVALQGFSPLSGTPDPSEVAVLPHDDRGRKAALSMPAARVCLLSARALEPDLAERAGVHLALPLSDHAGFDQLVAFALQSGASRVLTAHGYAEDLAQALRKRGMPARAIDHEKQLELFRA